MTREAYKKHKELIEAWVDGAEIEYNNRYTSGWSLCTTEPNWDENTEYRIKPKDATLYEWMVQYPSGGWDILNALYTEDTAAKRFTSYRDFRKTGREFNS